MRSPFRPVGLLAGLLILHLAPSHARADAAPSWEPIADVIDATKGRSRDLSADALEGPLFLELPFAVPVDGRRYGHLLVDDGAVLFVEPIPPGPPSERRRETLVDGRPGDAAEERIEPGPRIEILSGPGLRLLPPPRGRVLVFESEDFFAVRWIGLVTSLAEGPAIVELLARPDGVVAQYLRVPWGGLPLEKTAAGNSRPAAFRLGEELGSVVRPPLGEPPLAFADDPPPPDCLEPAEATWCEQTGPDCDGGASPCSQRVDNIWEFNEGDFCKDCEKTFYILVECGREMHIPFWDMEALDLEITNVVTGVKPDLRCRNETAIGLGPSRSWTGPSCGPTKPGPWWSPYLDVTNNAGQGHVSFSDSTPDDGDCTTQGSVDCADLPIAGEAPTVVHGEEQTIDCWIEDETGLCGIYRIDIISGGFVWDLFANCDGTNTPNFDIYFDCTEAWADYEPLPELAISNVSATGDCYTYDIAFDLLNIGCIDHPDDVLVTITSDCGDTLDTVVPGPIPGRSQVSHVQPFTLSCPDGLLTFTVDPLDWVAECTEDPAAAACRAELGTDTLEAGVICCPIISAGADKETCDGDAVGLIDASSQFSDTFLWDDGGAGGTFTPSASERNPSYLPPPGGPANITLTLTGTFFESGCMESDSLELVVHPNPALDAGADRSACAGDPVPLDDVAPDLANQFAWSDGGAGGSFAPSANVQSPTYTNFNVGTHVLSLTGTVAATGCQSTDTLEVTIDELPVLDAGPDAQACAGDDVPLAGVSPGSADVFAWSDGGAGGTFTPSPDVQEPSYTNASAGAFLLTLTATNAATGCQSTDERLVTFAAHPDISAGTDKTTCDGQAAALSDAQGGTADVFSWDDGGAGGTFLPSANVLTPTYANAIGVHSLTLTATDSSTGCTSVDTVQVEVVEVPVAEAGAPKTTCAGDAVALGDADGGTADTYTWTDGGVGGTFSPNPHVQNPSYSHPVAGVYELTLTASLSGTACSDSDTVEVEVDAVPIVVAGGPKETCVDVPRALDDAFASGGTDLLWDDGGAGGTFSPSATVLEASYSNSAAGTYTLTLTATRPATGCTSSDSASITVHPRPTVEAGPDTAACADGAAALGLASSSATSFSWSDGGAGGVFSPSASVLNPSYSNALPGSYVLTLTATDDEGCVDTDSLTVTIHALPVTEVGSDLEGCPGQPVSLASAASDADTFAWSDGGAGGSFSPSATVLNPTYTNGATGTFELTLTSTIAATGCVSSDSLLVSVRPDPVASFAPEGSAFCEDASVCFDNTSSDSTSWNWDFGDGGAGSGSFEPCYSYSEPGTYTVSLTATNLCSSDQVVMDVTVGAKPVADFESDTQGGKYCVSRPVDFTDLSTGSPTSWLWDFGDGNTSTEQNPTHTYTVDGIQIVSLIACNDCGCSPAVYQPLEIAATCQTNCEANSNQIGCSGSGPVVEVGNTCTDFDGFNTTSYACAPEVFLSGNNKTYDLNFLAGSNFLITLTETDPEPNGYDLDLLLSDQCNPPTCVSYGDTMVVYDDRTPENDDFFLIVDGRDGTCGPFELSIDCLDDTETANCEGPDFGGIVAATDIDSCNITGILVEWLPALDWGLDTAGAGCSEGVYEIWRAPADDPADEVRVGTAAETETSFVDDNVVPGVEYIYRVDAMNLCCAEVTITTATANATDDFGNAIDLSVGADGVISCLNPDHALTASASGGSGAGFSYAWEPTAGLSDPNVANPVATLPGTYTVTATDLGDGCTASDTIFVANDAVPPEVSAGPDRVLSCGQPAATLDGHAAGGNGSMGYAYAWAPAALVDDPSSPTPTTTTPGPYTLTVTDLASGCTAEDTVMVTENLAAPVASAGANRELTCAVAEVTLEGGATGGDGSAGYSHAWSPAAGVSDPALPMPTTSLPGVYVLTVTDLANGCTDTDSVVVVLNDTPPVSVAGPDRQLSCDGSAVTLNGNALGGDGSEGYAYAWSPAEAVSDAAAEDPTTSVPGTYTLTVTDVHTGCTAEDTVVVAPAAESPSADAGPDAEITCSVGTAMLTGSASGGDDSMGYTFAWEPAADVADPDAASTSTTVPGTYTLTVTSVADGCVGVDTVVVADLTGAPISEAGPDAFLTCASGTATLEGSASGSDGRDGYAFSWDPAGQVSDPTAAMPTTSVAGTYTLTVTDLYTGCTGVDTVEVQDDTAAPTAEAGPGATLTCSTTSVALNGSASGGNGSAGYSYAWDPPGDVSDPAIPNPTTSLPGTYTLTVTDLFNGCVDSDSVTVLQDVAAPTADAGGDQVMPCDGSTVPLSGSASGGNGSSGYSFHWEPAGLVVDPDVAAAQATAPATFTLTVTDLANGCTDTDVVVVTPDPGAPVADAGPDSSISCDDPDAALAGSVSGGDGTQGFTAQWTPTAGVGSPGSLVTTTTVPGTYTLVVTDVATGCQASDTVVVTDDTVAPVADAGPDVELTCLQDPVALSGSASGGNDSQGYTYLWSPAVGLSDPTVANPTASLGGVYTLTVTAVASGCSSTDSLTVLDLREPPSSNAGPDQTLSCGFPTATLSGSAFGGSGAGAFTYAWAPAADVSDPSSPTTTTSVPGTYQLTVTDVTTGCTDVDEVSVVQDLTSPVADAGPDGTLDCDSSIVILDGGASGGNGSAGYSYQWTPEAGLANPTTSRPVALEPGTYTLTVTDLANGCTDTDQVVVSEDVEAPVAAAGPDRVLDCTTAMVTLQGSATGGDASAGYAWAWEPASDVSDPSIAMPTVSEPGTYTLTATAVATGCSSTDTVVVTRDVLAPIAEAGPPATLTCENPNVTLAGAASGGNGGAGYSYAWEPAADVSDPTVPTPTTGIAGVYTLTVTDLANGCTATDSVVVTQDEAVPLADAGPDQAIGCDSPTVMLQGAAAGGNGSMGFAYAWEPAADLSDPSSPSPTTSVTGTYTLTVTDLANGCTAMDTVQVVDAALPVAEAGPVQQIDCVDSIVTLAGSASGGDGSEGFLYSWEPAADVSNPNIAMPTTITPGSYTLTVTDLATGCTSVDSVDVVRDVELPIASAGPDHELDCTLTQVVLEGSVTGGNDTQGYQYSWSPAGDLSDPNVAAPTTSMPGIYTLTVTAVATGCSDVDTVFVAGNQEAPVAEAGPDRTLTCDVTEVALEGSAVGGDGSLGYSFSWEPAGDVSDPAAASPTTSTPGVYTLTVTDLANGCTGVDTVTVGEDVTPPVADAGPDVQLDCASPTVALTGSGSGGSGGGDFEYAWSPAGAVTDPTSASTEATATGTFTLTVTDLVNGCTDSDTVVVGSADPPPVAEAGPGTSITCTDGVADLSGSATGGDGSMGYSFEWSPIVGVADPAAAVTTTTQPGTYTLVVEDIATGCRSTDTVVIVDDRTPPVADAGPSPTLSCAVTDVVLQGSASGGNGSGGYSYAWEPAADLSDPSSPTPSTSTPGTYVLTVTDLANGCTGSSAVMVLEDVAAPVADAGPDPVLGCQGAVTLNGSASAGNGSQGYTYAWEPAADVSDPSSPTPTTSVVGVYTLTATSVANGCSSTDQVEVLFDMTPPIAEAGPDQVRTCMDPTVTLEGAASGGNGAAGYAFAWEPAADVSDPAAERPETSVSGTYTLTVTDLANGCSATDTVLVTDTVNDPVVDAGADQVIDCTVGTVTLTGSATGGDDSAGREYLWSPEAVVTDPTAATTDATAAGIYTLTVTDLATGCSSTDTVEVTSLQASPIAEAGPDSVIRCDRGFAFLSGSATGGDGREGYSASWSPTAGVDNPNSFTTRTTVPGVYTLVATDNFTGCQSFDTVLIEQNAVPPTVDAGPDGQITCRDPVALLQGSASGGDGSQGYIYAWTPADDVADPTAPVTTTMLPGTYTLTVTDRANGCEASDEVVISGSIDPPVAEAGDDPSLTCSVSQVTLQGSASGGDGSAGYAYAWSPRALLSNPFSANPTTMTAGTYELTVTDLATGCQASDTVTVVIDQDAPTVDAGDDVLIGCDGLPAQLDGSASGGNGALGYEYSWTPAADVSDPSLPNPTTSVAGAYTLTVVDLANGCTSSDVVVVTRDTNAPLVSAGPDRTINCVTRTVELTGSAIGGNGTMGYSYSWEPAADVSDPSIENPMTSVPGTYTLTVTDLANGCTSVDSVEVVSDDEPPVPEAGPDLRLDCANASVTLQGSATGGNGSMGYAYEWSPAAGLSDPDAAQPEATLPGTYTVRVTDLANGCEATDTVVVGSDFRAPAADAGSDRLFDCVVGSAPLVGSASGGNGSAGYAYRWEPAIGVADPDAAVTEALAVGTYTLTVTDLANGCTAEDTVEVVAQDSLRADAGPDATLTCARTEVALTGSVSGGDGSGGFLVRWEPSDGVADPSSLETTTTEAGQYTLVVIDLATGCRAADFVEVTLDTEAPVAEAGGDQELTCSVASVPLSGSASGGNGALGYAYSWAPAAGVIDASAAMTEATAPGVYTLTVVDLVNGCVGTDTVEVTENAAGPVADAGPDLELGCGTAQVDLVGVASGGDGSMGYTYRWEPAGDVADPDVAVTTTTVPGLYVLTVTDVATGCVSSDAVEVGFEPTLPPTEPSALDQRPSAAPLRVGWSDPFTRAELEVRWEDVSASRYVLHAGTLAGLPGGYDHGRLACDLPAPSHVFAPSAGVASYFLAASVNCEGEESSSGRSSRGDERPAASPPCP